MIYIILTVFYNNSNLIIKMGIVNKGLYFSICFFMYKWDWFFLKDKTGIVITG